MALPEAAALLIHILLCNGHFAADAEGAAGDFQSGRGLFALVFVEIDPALYPAHRFLVKAMRDDVSRAQVFFHIKLEDFDREFHTAEVCPDLFDWALTRRWAVFRLWTLG